MPLALLSAAWTASLAGAGAPAAVGRRGRAAGTPPRRHRGPDRGDRGPRQRLRPGDARARASGLRPTADRRRPPPPPASRRPPCAAYQRAETVINAADKSCNLPVAADRRDRPGRVRPRPRPTATPSTTTGLAAPASTASPLNGTNNTAEILDTDAGQFDNDTTLRPRGRPDAVHPLDLVGRGRRRRRRRRAQPAGHRRRRAGAPRSTSAPAPTTSATDAGQRGRGLPLQPQPVLRRPGALDHGGLHRRRLHLGPQRHRGGRLPRARATPTRPWRGGTTAAAATRTTTTARTAAAPPTGGEPTEPTTDPTGTPAATAPAARRQPAAAPAATATTPTAARGGRRSRRCRPTVDRAGRRRSSPRPRPSRSARSSGVDRQPARPQSTTFAQCVDDLLNPRGCGRGDDVRVGSVSASSRVAD